MCIYIYATSNYAQHFTRSSDIWAIGCTLFFIIAGTPPFVAINDYQSFRKVEALDYTFPDGFYESAKDLIQKLLVRSSGPLSAARILMVRNPRCSILPIDSA